MPTASDLAHIQRAKTNEILLSDDLPQLEEWTNDLVSDIYGKCSRENHMLQALLQNRALLKSWLEIWNAEKPDQGTAHECQPFELCGLKTYRKVISGFCTSCHGKLRFQLCPARLQAICKLSKPRTWAAVVTRQNGSRARPRYVFDGVHRCGIMKPNHCMRKQHVNLEMFQQTATRKKCHAGKEKCRCPRQCFGEKVVLGRRGLYEDDLI